MSRCHSHPYLPSFPTRRSSDLLEECVHREVAGIRLDGPGLELADVEQRVERSEEHTSELQSRQYLVCRLLLEKKKKHEIEENNVVGFNYYISSIATYDNCVVVW